MRAILFTFLAFLIFFLGGVTVHYAGPAAYRTLDEAAAAVGIDVAEVAGDERQGRVAPAMMLAEANTGAAQKEAAEADRKGLPDGAATDGQEAGSDDAAVSGDESDGPSTLNAFAPTDEASATMPPIGLPDPKDAQADLPDGQKIALKAAPDEAPEIGEVRWVPSALYCGFVRADLPNDLDLASLDDADGAATIEAMPDASSETEEAAATVNEQSPEDFAFVTERFYDGRAAVERGYMRLGGLMRELKLKNVEEAEGGEVRHYETFGSAPISVRIDMQRIMTEADKRLKAWHKPPRLLYRGAISVSRGGGTRQAGFVGSCS